MDKIKFWINTVIKFSIILLISYIIYSWNKNSKTLQIISPHDQIHIDSLNRDNMLLIIENERYKEHVNNLYFQISQLENQLSQISHSTEKRIIEYRNAAPEKKKEIIEYKIKQMQEEMNNQYITYLKENIK